MKRPKVSPPLESSGCSLIFGLFWTIFSSVFLFIGIGVFISETVNYPGLLREGVTAFATITYTVAFVFKILTGSANEWVITRAEQNRKAHDRYRIGDLLTVRYLPDDSSIRQMILDHT